MTVDQPMSEAEAKAAEARHLQAVAADADRRGKIARIKQLKAGGMSRRRLIETYGQDLVDLALIAL